MSTATVNDVIPPKSITATNTQMNSKKCAHHKEDVMSPEVIAAIDNTFAIRFLGRPLAKVETRVVPVVCKVADKTLTTAGKIAISLGFACLKAGEHAVAYGNLFLPRCPAAGTEKAVSTSSKLAHNAELAKTRARRANAHQYAAIEALRKIDQ